MSELKHFSPDILSSPDERATNDLGSVAMPEVVKEQYHVAITSRLPGSTVIEGQLVFSDMGGPGASTIMEIE